MSDDNDNNVIDLFTRKSKIEVEDASDKPAELETLKEAKEHLDHMVADGLNHFLIIGINNEDPEFDANYAFAMTDGWRTSDLSLAADYMKLQIMQRLSSAVVDEDIDE